MTSKLPVCVFSWDGIVDSRARKPVECCENCKLPKGHERHELPETPAEVVAIEARRLGEPAELEN